MNILSDLNKKKPILPVIDYSGSSPCFIEFTFFLQEITLFAYKSKDIIGTLIFYCNMIEGLKGGFVFSKNFFYYLQGYTKVVLQVGCIFYSQQALGILIILESNGITPGVSINIIFEPASTCWTPFV